MTKVKSPRLKIFMGSVRISNTGLKNAFNMLKIAAAKNAGIKPPTWIPSSKYELVIIENVKISHLTKMPFISTTSSARIFHENFGFSKAAVVLF
jgi:hypothetical protein